MPSSTEFNEVCYMARYPDLAAVKWYGWNAPAQQWQYKPSGSSAFDCNWYGGNCDHLKPFLTISDNPYLHYTNMGIIEGRVPGCDLPGTQYSNEFNSAAYLARYWDVRNSPIYKNDPLKHYKEVGQAQGRHPGYEIITPQSPVGLVTPGTTINVADVKPPDATPTGDNTVIPVPSNPLTPQQLSANKVKSYIFIGGALFALLFLLRKKKNKNEKV